MRTHEPEFPTEVLNQQMAMAWLSWLKYSKGRSDETLRAYATTLGAWCDWLGDYPAAEADATMMERFTQRSSRKGPRGDRTYRPRAAATRRKEVSVLRGFYEWATNVGHVDRSPAALLCAPTVHNVNPKPVPDDVWHDLWHACESPLTRAWLGLGYYVGLRRAEIIGLSKNQITEYTIRDFRRKGGGEHTVPWREMCEIIEAKLPEVWEPSFPSDLRRVTWDRSTNSYYQGLLLPQLGDDQNLNKMLDKLTAKAGVQHLTPHMLRHSCATNLLRAGVPLHLVASLMNHSSIQVTMRYVASGGNQLKEWMRKNLE